MVEPAHTGTAARAWLQRVARVRSRLGQVWTRTDGYKETLLVIDNPVPTKEPLTLSLIPLALSREGWCHTVFSLERGERFAMNETWFSASESGKSSVFGRVV